MSSEITSINVRNLHIYNNGYIHPEKITLCLKHRKELRNEISSSINQLVSTRLFQKKIKTIFQKDSEKNFRIRIRITDDKLTVQKIDKQGVLIGNLQKINFVNSPDFNEEDIEDAKIINRVILKKANRIFQDHLKELCYENPSITSLSKKASRAKKQSSYKMNRQRRASQCNHSNSFSSQSPINNHQIKDFFNQKPSNLQADADLYQRESLGPLSHQTAKKKSSKHKTSLKNREQKTNSSTPSSDQLQARLNQHCNLDDPLNSIPKQPPTDPIESSLSFANFNKLSQLSEALASLRGSYYFPPDLKEEFLKLPQTVRYAIYYQTYLLCDPLQARDPWPIGQKLFEGIPALPNGEIPEITADNVCRSHAIRQYLLHSLGIDFSHIEGNIPPPEFLRRFYLLPDQDKNEVFKQLEFIESQKPHSSGSHHSFTRRDHLGATNLERSIALNRVTLDRVAEYHRHANRERIHEIETVFQQAYRQLQNQAINDLQKQEEEYQRQLQELNRQ